MKGISRVLFLAVLAHIGHPSLSTSGAPLENPFPLGTIGCLASDVCGPGEVCKDDLLFGSCQDVYGVHRSWVGGQGVRGGDVFRLESPEIEQLEQTIWTLIQDGFTWQDAYTQCTLQNLLVAFQRGRRFRPSLCEDALGVSLPGGADSWTGQANAEVAAILKELLQSSGAGRSLNSPFYPSSSSSSSYPMLGQTDEMGGLERDGELQEKYGDGLYPGQGDSVLYPGQGDSGLYPGQEDGGGYGGEDLLGSNKRDEFVQVHKYFDQSKGQLKRDPFLRDDVDPYNFLTAFPQEAVQVHSDHAPPKQDGDRFAPSAPVLPSAVEPTSDEVEEDEGRFFDLPQAPAEADGMESSMGRDLSLDVPPVQSQDDTEEKDESLSLSSNDEATLEQLLEGSVEPDQLPVAQQKRLSRFIEMMISMLEMRGTQHMNDVDIVEEAGPEEVPPSEHNPIATQEAATKSEDDDDNSRVPVKEESAEVGEEGLGEAAEPVDSDADDGDKEDVDLSLDKKSPPGAADDSSEDSDNTAVVQIKYTYLKLNDKVDEKKAEDFVRNLTRELHIPPGVATLDDVNGDQLILKVAQDPQWNSSRLAQEAQSSAALQQETGIKVVDAGVGKGVTVEVQKKNGGYELLTFTLVGSIAGVVLAVTIIYLLKRHRRSREKLAQLASTGDGNEASKDYQDLCRQRMQSKASEKPEPLHAASRIGSVSESAVRSPSSRSSTSSWSEEPAASNMDISTGHVVLSYMEDHLKNQDRLDQEWEALAAYQADPCSTSVATDQSNARKNRYSDVLPYDHSRVVLSAATNVSNSDYVNASFITDHDPRNPAYICTQGPLPHTVADFWQMVWEQGSVVIVMLTKLTENGTAMCHRYWPEEGSDLYHIYEVHLVSEHIWCDDYLVRSFYLKNLQTNETRTVTQFHFLTWTHLSVPPSMKALLDFRRKVNKSFRGGSCPIVLHCNDGCGRSGTYCLVDMVLNRMAKGAKEIDMAATLEHIRDQRMNMVQTKEQFQFALSAVAEEVHAILKAMPQ